MAISRMQEPQQIQSGIGSLQDPRQGYFLGKLVKKAGRAVKKITKSPLGKMALFAAGANFAPMLFGKQTLLSQAGGLGGLLGKVKAGLGTGGKFSTLGDLFRVGGKSGADFSIPRMLAGGLGATAIAAPFFMGGDDEEEVTEVMDPRYQVQRAKNYYSGAGEAGAGLDFMPQKKYVMQNFYAADGGRAGYSDGMLVEEDDEEEFIRSGAGRSFRQPKTFLNMGGGAGQAQAEQMLMMEYVKYKNKGGDMSFEQFVKAVMQASQQPEGAGMEQPQAVAMAANGGRIGRANGGIMEAEEASEMIDMGGMEKDYRNEGGFVAMGGKERADDVPARLSKNEFVFTADAVRNAGGGDIDKGAEVMENLMNNLEQGGEVSEDSQGLEGAQAMYEQQQMLQSRMI